MAAGYEKQQELRRTVAGIRARTPKRVGPLYDEPSENERRLRGVARRTPKRTMTMDEESAKETPPKSSRPVSKGETASAGKKKTAARKSVPQMANVNAPRKLSVGGSAKGEEASSSSDGGKFNLKLHEAVGKAGLTKTEEARKEPARTEAKAAPAKAASKSARKKSRLRRAAGAVGKAARYVGRGVRAVFKGRRKSQSRKA